MPHTDGARLSGQTASGEHSDAGSGCELWRSKRVGAKMSGEPEDSPLSATHEPVLPKFGSERDYP